MTDVAESRDQAGAELSAADEQLLRELTERARTGGLKLTGEGGLLGRCFLYAGGGPGKALAAVGAPDLVAVGPHGEGGGDGDQGELLGGGGGGSGGCIGAPFRDLAA
jgi:hypothetical protein